MYGIWHECQKVLKKHENRKTSIAPQGARRRKIAKLLKEVRLWNEIYVRHRAGI